jgi:hypothetical protein
MIDFSLFYLRCLRIKKQQQQEEQQQQQQQNMIAYTYLFSEVIPILLADVVIVGGFAVVHPIERIEPSTCWCHGWVAEPQVPLAWQQHAT